MSLRGISRFALFPLVATLALAGCADTPPAGGAGTPYGSDNILKTDASELRQTVVVPTLDAPLAAGKNVLWCATFQLAWNELLDLLGDDVRIEGGPDIADSLNRRTGTKADIDDASFVAMAGYVNDGFWNRVRAALQEKFPGERFDLVDSPTAHVLATYAALIKNIEFDKEFESRNDRLIGFGGRPAQFFGFGMDSERSGELSRQVKLLDFRENEDTPEVVIEFVTKSPRDHLILAMLPPGRTLGETVAEVRRRCVPKPKGEDEDTDFWFSELAVPKLDFDLRQTYDELEGRQILNVGMPLGTVLQSIRFRLNERGALLKSEAAGTAIGIPSKLIFDRPFLILMERAGAKAPYFALWVDNAELLVPESPERMRIARTYAFDEARRFNEGIAAVRVGDRWGYVDAKGHRVAGPQFALAGDFHEGLARVAVWREAVEPKRAEQADPEDDAEPERVLKWGYIDRTGKMVIPATFDYAWRFSDGLARVTVGKEGGSHRDVYDEADCVSDGFFFYEPVRGKRGYIDRSGKFIIPPTYDYATPFVDGVACVGLLREGEERVSLDEKDTSKWGYRLIDRSGRTILGGMAWLPDDFSEGLSSVKDGSLFGYIDRAGKWVIQPQFESALGFRDGHACVVKDDRYGFIDRSGNFSPCRVKANWVAADRIAEGRADFEDNATGRIGFVDMKGRVVVAPQYHWAGPFSNGRALVAVADDAATTPAAEGQECGGQEARTPTRRGFIDRDGKPVTKFEFDDAFSFREGLAAVWTKEKHWGFIDTAGRMVIPQQYLYAEEFHEGLCPVAIQMGIDENGRPRPIWGFIDKSGKLLEISP